MSANTWPNISLPPLDPEVAQLQADESQLEYIDPIKTLKDPGTVFTPVKAFPPYISTQLMNWDCTVRRNKPLLDSKHQGTPSPTNIETPRVPLPHRGGFLRATSVPPIEFLVNGGIQRIAFYDRPRFWMDRSDDRATFPNGMLTLAIDWPGYPVMKQLEKISPVVTRRELAAIAGKFVKGAFNQMQKFPAELGQERWAVGYYGIDWDQIWIKSITLSISGAWLVDLEVNVPGSRLSLVPSPLEVSTLLYWASRPELR
ncbi:hypothetical protein JAAARDRAFT_33436 [Jaapia argillacea MUCL 33604]|uniref:Uncharacterized protein n=1 Tax=Jaapia argillacea MUCL 33604 TaxID=933084 RepID=A0A067Q160_9AGAM|nr:hypothetical protein JAAARDRAFT_33436 [Jaapia argillacea MUCL 33604]